jgi:hypothetical protein
MLHVGKANSRPSIWSHEPILTPEKRVWRAVLTQALEDAEMTPIDGETGSESLEAFRARRYLRADSQFEAANVKLVCDFADLPADRVILWARRQYPPEQTFEEHVECDGLPPLFLPPRSHHLPCILRWQTEKQERGSRTPQMATSPQAPVPA